MLESDAANDTNVVIRSEEIMDIKDVNCTFDLGETDQMAAQLDLNF